MVSFSDEALETFSPECMESSSIRSMGGVVHTSKHSTFFKGRAAEVYAYLRRLLTKFGAGHLKRNEAKLDEERTF